MHQSLVNWIQIKTEKTQANHLNQIINFCYGYFDQKLNLAMLKYTFITAAPSYRCGLLAAPPPILDIKLGENSTGICLTNVGSSKVQFPIKRNGMLAKCPDKSVEGSSSLPKWATCPESSHVFVCSRHKMSLLDDGMLLVVRF